MLKILNIRIITNIMLLSAKTIICRHWGGNTLKRKKLKPLAVLTTAAVLSSTFAFGGHAAYAETPTSSLPIDEHLIPEERLAEALKQRGN